MPNTHPYIMKQYSHLVGAVAGRWRRNWFKHWYCVVVLCCLLFVLLCRE